MMTKAKCPHCGYIIMLHPRALGREVPCPGCDTKIKLPTRESVELAKAAKAPKTFTSAAMVAPQTAPVAPKTQAPVDQTPPEDAPTPRLKKRKKRGHVDHSEAWDITPMVDVAFLLLIFFMVTGSFSIQKVIRTARQVSDRPSKNTVVREVQEAVHSVTVQVDEQDAFTVVMPDGGREEAISKQDLIILLTRAKEEAGEDCQELTVQAHEESTHGAVVTALDSGRAAKFSKFKTTVVDQF